MTRAAYPRTPARQIETTLSEYVLNWKSPQPPDLPAIDAVMVEIPNPAHPYGVKGVGEIPLVPPLAAIANAIADASGKRLYELPMSPPKVLEALGE